LQIAVQARGLLGDACLSQTPAMPYDCIVREETGTTNTLLPACNGGASSTNKPCWEFVVDAINCPANLKLVVQRNTAPAPNAVVVATCRL
jgi:hypothetical protein